MGFDGVYCGFTCGSLGVEMNKNLCPECEAANPKRNGELYCHVYGISWWDECSTCDYRIHHSNRRKELKKIDFEDRRKEPI
jgi:uncharacterized Zn finger protein (UPF0148 family)